MKTSKTTTIALRDSFWRQVLGRISWPTRTKKSKGVPVDTLQAKNHVIVKTRLKWNMGAGLHDINW